MKKKNTVRLALGIAALIVICAVGWVYGAPYIQMGSTASLNTMQPIQEEQGIKRMASVKDGHLAVYDGTEWKPEFWNGINMGATTPGHAPGELSPSKEDYLRWFGQMKDMNVNVLRIYTILPPYFYEALAEFNSGRKDPLYMLHGIWSPEEALMGENGQPRDALQEDTIEQFRQEIKDAVQVVHGKINLKSNPGHASGKFTADVSPYLLGWIVGTEWDPYVVKKTDDAHPGMKPFAGTYFQASADASPFESWLAQMLDTVAQEEMKFGWQRPVSFTNWVTTDPLTHPNEPADNEDLVSVDPMHVSPTEQWTAGYFASYHVYPYYPDLLRYEEKYQTYKDSTGEINPYAGYLHDLRAHHQGIPLIVAEYGVPSSRGMAHFGPVGRNQGMHTEKEQGEINADLYRSIYDEKLDGAVMFSWQDEWFKITWNTMDLDAPIQRRPFWRNMLTNEEHFGVIAVEPGRSKEDLIMLDGKTADWERKKNAVVKDYPQFSLTTVHDEAYVYMMLKKKEGSWQTGQQPLDIGFDTLDGGSTTSDKAPGVAFGKGQEFMLRIKGADDSAIYVNSAYDQHTWLYGSVQKLIPWKQEFARDGSGIFLPWKLPTSKELYLPQSKKKVPFEDVEIGIMKPGITDPDSPEFNNLADWYASGDVMEIRIPWMLLGFTDPSTAKVWRYPYEAGGLKFVETKGIRIEPHLQPASGAQEAAVEPVQYKWNKWEKPEYHERFKQSYDILKQAFGEKRPPKS
ncbi:hypothetical protein ACFQ88_33355 [Paenibacillus sp. NPDC056579]|uniref:hypothetical protein n=1 Tax=Paenibacillus sp. NPDC056579 TaxID=3345871 RepID=UPI003675FBCB